MTPSRWRAASLAGGLATSAALFLMGTLGVGVLAILSGLIDASVRINVLEVLRLTGTTLLLAGVSALGAAPLGIGVAVWARWSAPKPLRPAARWWVGVVSDIPAVAWGAGLLLLPIPEPWGPWVRAWLGLALVATPAVARRALDALSTVPGDELVAAVALGARRGEAIAWVGLPRASRGLVRAVFAGVGRATSETVVLLLVLEPAGVFTLGQAVVLSALEPTLVSPSLGVASAGALLLLGLATYAIGRLDGSS